ncbi:MAG: asparaginase [Dysgonamonadaceae bacterium]|jgi:L-asparaginase|nr:asparaginase [Dysgonamonadaceae bacterium]
MIDNNASVLLIYTGGTIGMIEDPNTGSLKPFDFKHLKDNMPELKQFKFAIDTLEFDPPLDSSDMGPCNWKKLVRIIQDHYEQYDGFVILHGTDTMAYTASALSFMLENINKPVIFTGSQLPIGKMRTDGKENLITALEIAVDKDPYGNSIVMEVCIFFQDYLMRANRTTKVNAENFKAFHSYNYPALAEAGIHIKYELHLLHRPTARKPIRFHYLLDSNVMVLKLFPGLSQDILEAVFKIPSLKGVVLETYGSGNAPSLDWFLKIIKDAIVREIVVVNITQCLAGTVGPGRYHVGRILSDIGVIPGHDMTTEAAVAKLMYLFGHGMSATEVKERLLYSLTGEVSIS